MSTNSVARLKKLAWFMDSSVKIPGTGVRVGLDPLLGLVPVAGDIIGMCVSLYLVAEALKLKTRPHHMAQILGYIVIDGVIGMVPVVGDAFDFVFKANDKIIRLLEREHFASASKLSQDT